MPKYLRTAPDRIVSVHDRESRHIHKTVHNYRDGFKAHLAAEPETGLVTAYGVTKGNVGDAQAAPDLIAGEPEGIDVFGDSAYGSGEFRSHLDESKHRAVIKPIPLREVVPGGFTIDDFAVDLAAMTVTCPAEHTVNIRKGGRASFKHRCDGCPLRERCTTSASGRNVSIHPQFALLHSARQQAKNPEFQQELTHWRPMAERAIAWVVAKGHRRVPYRGIKRNELWLGHRIAGINPRRLLNLGLRLGPDGWALS